ncbi:hypothetical protein [Amphritea sp. HPY]|uniref:hypothetical protein n=1 Tax=Amphritea sp. HPY TaxID=3421652 RepID=UPI003D7E2604
MAQAPLLVARKIKSKKQKAKSKKQKAKSKKQKAKKEAICLLFPFPTDDGWRTNRCHGLQYNDLYSSTAAVKFWTNLRAG